MEGVVTSNKEKETTENLLSQMSSDIQKIYTETKEENWKKWLMIYLKTSNEVYSDVLNLIRIRRLS